jgi:cytochrome c2
MPWLRSNLIAILAALAVVAVAGTVVVNQRFAQADIRHRAEALTGGRVDRGHDLFISKGCGGCHALAGISEATGLVGPPLDNVAERAVIGGMLANSPPNLTRWISAPQSVVPGNAMPDIPMTGQEASDIAAFLYSRN